jgi:hypothetical protein
MSATKAYEHPLDRAPLITGTISTNPAVSAAASIWQLSLIWSVLERLSH